MDAGQYSIVASERAVAVDERTYAFSCSGGAHSFQFQEKFDGTYQDTGEDLGGNLLVRRDRCLPKRGSPTERSARLRRGKRSIAPRTNQGL